MFRTIRSTIRPLIQIPKRSISFQPKKAITKGKKKGKNESGSPFTNSFTFQLFIIVGAMGAGYSLGKSIITEKPPKDLFPSGSTTSLDDLSAPVSRKYGDYDKFKRCILRILEEQGYTIDQKDYKNETLFNDPLISKDVAQVMNETGFIKQLFFGKQDKQIDQRKFTFHPLNKEQVSCILKCCHEFKIPVFTSSQGYQFYSGKIPYRIEIDFNRMNAITKDSDDSYTVQSGVDGKELFAQLKNDKVYVNSNESPLDILLSFLGIERSDTDGRLINNKFDRESIDKITNILPDGSIIETSNDTSDATSYRLFESFKHTVDDISIVTDYQIHGEIAHRNTPTELFLMGFKDLPKLNETVKFIKKALPNIKVGFMDSVKCKPLSESFGGLTTFCVITLSPNDISKLGRNFCKGNNDMQIFRFDLNDLPPKNPKLYYSNQLQQKPEFHASSALIISDDLLNQDPKTYLLTNPYTETKYTDQSSGVIKKDLQRRLKLSLDPFSVLNPGFSCTVEMEKEEKKE